MIAAHFGLQPGFGQPPIPHHRINRHRQDCRGFLPAQPAKEPEFDDAALALVELRECLQRVIERDKVLTGLVGHDKCLVESHARGAAAAFVRAPRAGVVDEDAPHDPRRHGQEMRAVVPLDRFSVNQADIGLVDERGRLETVTHALSGHAAARDLVELLVDERDQSLAGVVVSLPPFEKERGDVRGVRGNPDILGTTITWSTNQTPTPRSSLLPSFLACSSSGGAFPLPKTGGRCNDE